MISVKVGVFQRGWVNLSANFRWKGTWPTNPRCCQKTRLITLSCDIKISAVCSIVSSQSTRVTDGQTEGRTYRITIPKTALAHMLRAVKMINANRYKFTNVTCLSYSFRKVLEKLYVGWKYRSYSLCEYNSSLIE